MLDRETLASDVLENWTPNLPDAHPDDCPRAFDDDGAPLLRCPMTQERPTNFRDGSPVLESGAIEGAGGTWWIPKSSAWSVEPSRIRALSPRGRSWLKATLSRLSHATTPGETDQRTGPLRSAYRNAHNACNASGRGKSTEREAYRTDCKAWRGIDAATGETVLTLNVPRSHALEILNAYGIAGRPLVLRPA